jgi:integrase
MIASRLNEDVAEGNYGRATANDYREILQRMFNHAIELHGYVCPDHRYKHPVEGVKRFKESAPIITYLKLADIGPQLDAVAGNPTIHAAVATMIYAGLRRAEVFWLTDDDIDLDRRLIYVRAKVVEGRQWEPKTKKNRPVPISTKLLPILTAYIAGRGEPASPWFFPAPAGGWWDPDNFSSDLAALNADAGLSWSSLDYRHTFGSQLAQNGVSLYKISAMMGNSPEIARRHYAALCPEAMHADVEFADARGPTAIDPGEGPHLRLVV